ncbi:VOC family protein [Paenibacillus wenxiniae]|uniref:VOC family protein n=1 Tax=Paenibacillus wenxiniae TaxID=1636843 RepID=A0ABW4RQA0_9BACL
MNSNQTTSTTKTTAQVHPEHVHSQVTKQETSQITQTEVIPFLSLNGKAAEAIAFYEQLGATVRLKVTYAQLAAIDDSFHVQPGQENYITHSVLELGSGKWMIAEEPADIEQTWQHGNSFSLCLQSRQHEEMEALYTKLTADPRCTIIVPFGPNSFSSGYAAVRDPFGVVFQFTVTRHAF